MPDLALYAMHVAYWATLGLARWALGGRAPSSGAPAAASTTTAPFSRALVGLHMVAFGVMYFGIGNAVLGNRVPERFWGQRLAGAVVIAVGAALAAWALAAFRSWRFRAQVEAGHELATGGPFAWVRNPIYLSLDLLALGSLLWVPTATLAVALILMVIGSDLRARAEERILSQSFGPAYASYRARTHRFVPGIY